MRWPNNHSLTTDVSSLVVSPSPTVEKQLTVDQITKSQDRRPPCCIILAAGEGRRLSMPKKGPKPTHEVLGLSLGERTILACMAAGVSRFIVVLGSQAEAVQAHFAQVSMRRGCTIEFVVAANWHLGNGISALAARDSITDDHFLLVMPNNNPLKL